MSYKTVTKKSYEDTATEFAKNVENLAPLESIEKFLKLLPPQAKIIDIGCAAGRDAKIFTEKGVSVLGIDFSQKMIDLAKAHAPLAKFELMDIENASLQKASFDGVWACCSLLHIPKKNLLSVLNNIHTCLKSSGYVYLSLKKGSGEHLENDLRYGEHQKFWSYYEENEMKDILQQAHFKILELTVVEKTTAYQTHDALRIFCQKE